MHQGDGYNTVTNAVIISYSKKPANLAGFFTNDIIQ